MASFQVATEKETVTPSWNYGAKVQAFMACNRLYNQLYI